METLRKAIYTPKIHEHVQFVLTEYFGYGYSIGDYFLRENRTFLSVDREAANALARPFFSASDVHLGFTEEDLFAKGKEEFVECYIEPVLEAKQTPGTMFDESHTELFALEWDMPETFVQDLLGLGIPLQDMNAWQVASAVMTGLELADAYDRPAEAGLLLANRIFVVPGMYGPWMGVVQHVLGRELYDRFAPDSGAAEQSGSYERLGIEGVNIAMGEFVHAVIASDERVLNIHTAITSGEYELEFAAREYLPLINGPDFDWGQLTPEMVDTRVIDALDEHHVRWEELMFSVGDSVFSEEPAMLYSQPWFADILIDHVMEIARLKHEKPIVPYDAVYQALGIGSIQTPNAWEERVLSRIFHEGRGFHIEIDSLKQARYWQKIALASCLPYLVGSCEMNAFAFVAYQKAVAIGNPQRYPKILRGDSGASGAGMPQQSSADRMHAVLQALPSVADAAWQSVHIPEFTGIFSEVNSLSLEATKTRIKSARRMQRVLEGTPAMDLMAALRSRDE